MSPARNVLKSVAGVGGRLLAFTTVSAVIGALLVGFLAPLVAATDAATKGSVQFFDSLPEELTINPPGQVSRILAADGSQIATVFSENRQDVTLKQIAPDMRNALVAICGSALNGNSTGTPARACACRRRSDQRCAHAHRCYCTERRTNDSMETV